VSSEAKGPEATGAEAKAPGLPTIDVNEYGAKRDGERQVSTRRLFMQLLVFDCPPRPDEAAAQLVAELDGREVPFVLYADVGNPFGLGLLTWTEDPWMFASKVRDAVVASAREGLRLLPELTMVGRTYSNGHEQDLEDALLRRPVRNVANEAYAWHVWYPLRRKGEFAALSPHDQAMILREHAQIGMAYGQQELAHDIRLACHGIDTQDNEFVIGLVGRELYPLSHLIQRMRSTKQTSEYILKMGPFFVGHVYYRGRAARA
jgi:chlorite dismutase